MHRNAAHTLADSYQKVTRNKQKHTSKPEPYQNGGGEALLFTEDTAMNFQNTVRAAGAQLPSQLFFLNCF